MSTNRISDLPISSALAGPELVEVSQSSATVRISGTTISALASDNSFNDSAAGFIASGLTVGDRVKVEGFVTTANNIFVGTITALTAGKLTIGGTDGDPIADESAGASVVISKWTSCRTTAQDIADLAAPGGGGGGAWSLQFGPLVNEPPATNYATIDTRNNRAVLDFDATTQEAAIFSGVLPFDYAGGGIIVTLFCSMSSATSGTIGWDLAVERTQASTDDIDSDSFATAQTVTAVTVPGTSGQVLAMSATITHGANMDNLAAGELFRLRIRRDVANDTATGDAELLRVMVREA